MSLDAECPTNAQPYLARRTLLASGLASLVLPPVHAQPQPQHAPAGGSGFDPIRDALKTAIERQEVPWVGLLVTRGDNDMFMHAEGVGPDHVDVLRSATKIATCTALMTLVQSGALSLEDPVARYIPAWGGDKASLSVGHLLSMNSGLPTRAQGFSDELSLAEAAAVIGRAPLEARPGERFIYGNLGLTVAGRVAEVASGQNWDAFFRSALGAPLGLNFTYGPLETGRLGGGGRSDLASYGRLLKLHLNGGLHEGQVILRSDLIARMQTSNGSVFRNPIPETEAYGYGMGWWFDRIDSSGRPLVISDPGAWGAYPWIDLERRYGAFLFVRKQLADGVRLVRRLRPMIETALAS